MSQMFKMMNGARIRVGLQGLAQGDVGYLNARSTRRSAASRALKEFDGPAADPIIEHADVRRMLIDMKARVDEVIRALVVKLARHQDEVRVYQRQHDQRAAYHQGQVDLLVPLVKSYGSIRPSGLRALAIQTYGGRGYTKGLPGRAGLPRCEDLLDLRGDEPHPGDGPGWPPRLVRTAARRVLRDGRSRYARG